MSSFTGNPKVKFPQTPVFRKRNLFLIKHSELLPHGVRLVTVHSLLFALATRKLRVPNHSSLGNIIGIPLFLLLALTLLPYPDITCTQIPTFINFFIFLILQLSLSCLTLPWNKVEYVFLTSLNVASKFGL
jgi:hypothetical protein